MKHCNRRTRKSFQMSHELVLQMGNGKISTTEGEFEHTESNRENAVELMLRSLKGKTLVGLDHPAERMWQLSFGSSSIIIECSWRILRQDTVVLGASDHGQQFGLPAPVDVMSEALRLLQAAAVEGISVSRTADLSIKFSGNLQIQVFNDSSGYEGWNYSDTAGVTVVALGEGKLAIWDNLPRKT